MKRSNLILLLIALFGLLIGVYLLVRAVRFYHFIHDIQKNNPELNYKDSLDLSPGADSLSAKAASLNQEIAALLVASHDPAKEKKQEVLFHVMDQFMTTLDSLKLSNAPHDERLNAIRVIMNQTNMGCREALFDTKASKTIPACNTFMILDMKKLNGTPFECLSEPELNASCFEMIRTEGLHLEEEILQANLLYLKKR